MKTVRFNKIKYVSCDIILNDAPVFSKGCRNTRNIIKNKKIPEDEYLFARFNQETKKWEESDGKSVKYDKVYVKQTYLENIPELNDENDEVMDDAGIQMAPDIIDLEDDEKFKDNDDCILEIETRGTRKCDGVYFKVKDVGKGFNIKRLQNTLIHKKSKYFNNVDYKYFTCEENDTIAKNKKVKKELFLTYQGILRVLFVSRSGDCEKFVKWATETLFTVQMGTKEQKEDLASGIIGIPVNSLKQVLSTSATSVPCIYRFALGTCKDLRKKMKIPKDIPDDHIIIKYGRAGNLVERTNQHIKEYGSIKGVKLELMNFAYIDPKYLSQAEVDIKEFFKDIEMPLEYKSYKELVIINPKHERQIKKYYKYMTDEYAGCVKELVDKIEELRRNIDCNKLEIKNLTMIHNLEMEKNKEMYKNELLEKDNELLAKDNELLAKDNELLTKDNELLTKDNESNMLKKDLEIEKLKNQLLMAKQ